MAGAGFEWLDDDDRHMLAGESDFCLTTTLAPVDVGLFTYLIKVVHAVGTTVGWYDEDDEDADETEDEHSDEVAAFLGPELESEVVVHLKINLVRQSKAMFDNANYFVQSLQRFA